MASFLVICTKLYIVYLIIAGLVTALQAANDIYLSDNKKQPHDSIKPNIQIVQLLVLAVGVLVSLSILISQDIKVLVGGLGAFAAVLILIFKDSIQGFVGGFLLKMNHLLQMGDWIAVPKYQVDGIVTDISLTTIQVQNWDNSISSIPTYSLVNDSFHNWQGMLQSGGRRIKRHINIDMTSIKFCSESMLEKYSKIKLLEQYIADKETELASYNRLFSNNFEAVNERQQTNLGIFRAYITRYLQAHQDIHDTMTVMVRQLPLTENGLPIEVYAFSKILSLVEYETLQADIIDHLLAIIPEFELRIFQSPTGADLRYEKHQNIA